MTFYKIMQKRNYAAHGKRATTQMNKTRSRSQSTPSRQQTSQVFQESPPENTAHSERYLQQDLSPFRSRFFNNAPPSEVVKEYL